MKVDRRKIFFVIVSIAIFIGGLLTSRFLFYDRFYNTVYIVKANNASRNILTMVIFLNYIKKDNIAEAAKFQEWVLDDVLVNLSSSLSIYDNKKIDSNLRRRVIFSLKLAKNYRKVNHIKNLEKMETTETKKSINALFNMKGV